MVAIGSLDYLYLFKDQSEININKSTLYASSEYSKSTKSESSSSQDIVDLSETAKIIIQNQNTSSVHADETPLLKEKIDEQYKQAEKDGTFINTDTDTGGKLLDWSSFTDEDLAQISLDKHNLFSKDIKNDALGALYARISVSITASSGGDITRQLESEYVLFGQLGDDVKAAIGETDLGHAALGRIIAWEYKVGNLTDLSSDLRSVMNGLAHNAQKGGVSLHSSKGGIENLLIYYKREELKYSSNTPNVTEKNKNLSSYEYTSQITEE
ncbi:hypothetical protein PY793_13240 [Acetobacter fabarum]|uniref:hypothetical protein n=1 Tax=Acetobacter fabarum TaxID=483199 RepID=UPI00312B4D35